MNNKSTLIVGASVVLSLLGSFATSFLVVQQDKATRGLNIMYIAPVKSPTPLETSTPPVTPTVTITPEITTPVVTTKPLAVKK